MGFHISSLSASAVPGRSWLPGTRVGKLGVRRALAIAEVLPSEAEVLQQFLVVETVSSRKTRR